MFLFSFYKISLIRWILRAWNEFQNRIKWLKNGSNNGLLVTFQGLVALLSICYWKLPCSCLIDLVLKTTSSFQYSEKYFCLIFNGKLWACGSKVSRFRKKKSSICILLGPLLIGSHDRVISFACYAKTLVLGHFSANFNCPFPIRYTLLQKS